MHKNSATSLRGPPPAPAMFDNLSVGLEKAWDAVRKDGKLTADNIKTPMREIRRALLEADVSLKEERGGQRRKTQNRADHRTPPPSAPACHAPRSFLSTSPSPSRHRSPSPSSASLWPGWKIKRWA